MLCMARLSTRLCTACLSSRLGTAFPYKNYIYSHHSIRPKLTISHTGYMYGCCRTSPKLTALKATEPTHLCGANTSFVHLRLYCGYKRLRMLQHSGKMAAWMPAPAFSQKLFQSSTGISSPRDAPFSSTNPLLFAKSFGVYSLDGRADVSKPISWYASATSSLQNKLERSS